MTDLIEAVTEYTWQRGKCHILGLDLSLRASLLIYKHSSIASAVALPEPPQYPGPEALPKRRQSISSNSSSKRRRLSADGFSERANQSTPPSSSNTQRLNGSSDVKAADKPKPGRDEERKRGRRLFGALLGTLSQSSSTPAQRKRSEIDKKQQAKLELQDKEYNELTKKKYEDLLASRRKDQVLYDSQSVCENHGCCLFSLMIRLTHSLHRPKFVTRTSLQWHTFSALKRNHHW